MNIKKGQTIYLKPEFLDSGDENITFIANHDSDYGRVTISDANSTMNIVPEHMITFEMILEAV